MKNNQFFERNYNHLQKNLLETIEKWRHYPEFKKKALYHFAFKMPKERLPDRFEEDIKFTQFPAGIMGQK